jgi:hypothetical protein
MSGPLVAVHVADSGNVAATPPPLALVAAAAAAVAAGAAGAALAPLALPLATRRLRTPDVMS